jgi:hypothetical protein
MLSSAVNGENHAPFEAFGLEPRRRLEWFAVRAEPSLDDAVATQTLVNPAGNRLDLRQLWHRLIGW